MEKFNKILVTPEMADEILKKNIVNRNAREHTVNRYAYDMKNGHFNAGYDMVVINKNGYLENGQHRLLAIKKSGISTYLWVVTEAEPNIESYDRGAGRTCADNLQIRFKRDGISVRNINTKIAIVRYILSYGFSIQKPSDVLLHNIIEEYDSGLSVAYTASTRKESKKNKPILRKAPIQTAIFCAFLNGVSPDDLCEFGSIANTGFPNEKWQTSPIILRNELMSWQGDGYAHRKRLESIAEQAIYDFARKFGRKRPYDSSKEPPYLKNVIEEFRRMEFK